MDKRDILIRLLGEETVSRMAGKAGDGLDKFGDSLDATERDAKDLDRQIGEVEGSLKALAVAFSRTSDVVDRVDLTKAMRRQQTELRRLMSAKNLIGNAGEEAAEKFGIQLVQRLGPIIARAPLGPAGAALGAIIGVPLAATVGAALAGGVIGGVGVGGVIGGLAIASRDARVQAAAKDLGETFQTTLEESAGAFVPAAIGGIGIIKAELQTMRGDLKSIFDGSARFVEPLTRGAMGGVREIVRGFRALVDVAGPVVEEISGGMVRIGQAIGDVFTDLADDADAGATGLRHMFMLVEGGIRFVGGFIGVLADLYVAFLRAGQAGAHFADAAFGWMPGIGDLIHHNREKIDELAAGLDKAGKDGESSLDVLLGGFQRVADGASEATEEVKDWKEVLAEMTEQNISAERANIALEEAIDRATDAAKENGKGIDANNPKQRANREALIAIAEAANRAHDATLTQTGSQELATQATERGRQKFMAAAAAMGVSKEEARKLADQLFKIPPGRSIAISTPGMPSALANAKLLKQRIDSIDRRIDIHAKMTVSYGGSAHTGQGYSTGYSEGGLVEGPGTSTSDSVRARLSKGEYVLTARDVAAAGGPSAIDRWRKGLAGVGRGGQVAPAMGAGGNSYHITVNVPPTANPAEVGRQTVEAIRAYEQRSGKAWRT